ncbi:MAG: hypothetical protein GWP18_00755 [Proteobacteria bacterium]|nr:hypothetical protein [Pseudomonadota bacterium]
MTITATDITEDPAEVRIRVDTHSGARILWWSFEQNPPPERTNYTEIAAIALVPYAMCVGSELRTTGSISRSLLGNLEDYRDYWTNVEPDTFSSFPIVPDDVDDSAVTIEETTAVLALSGGVHSTHTLLSRGRTSTDERSRAIVSAVLLRDFRSPPGDAVRTFDRCSAVCETTNTPLTAVSTNWHTDFSPPGCALSFMAGIAATLRLFAPVAGQGIVAATGTYGSVQHPSGSNPTSNAYLGDLRFPIVTSGFGLAQPAKARAVDNAL